MGLSLFITKVRFDNLHSMSLLSSPYQKDLEFAIHAADYIIYTHELPLIFYSRDKVEDG